MIHMARHTNKALQLPGSIGLLFRGYPHLSIAVWLFMIFVHYAFIYSHAQGFGVWFDGFFMISHSLGPSDTSHKLKVCVETDKLEIKRNTLYKQTADINLWTIKNINCNWTAFKIEPWFWSTSHEQQLTATLWYQVCQHIFLLHGYNGDHSLLDHTDLLYRSLLVPRLASITMEV
jgi:hypothetical protein